jgi:shikimate 5-dehydrogenase
MASTNGERKRVQSPSCDATPVDLKHFYIFGQGISFSVSPTIHLAGFGNYSLPHTYEIHQTKAVEELSSLISSPGFGGASVTMHINLQLGSSVPQ